MAITINTTTIQDMNRSFKKWDKTTSNDEYYRLKTTQILMAINRGYYVPQDELSMITAAPIAAEYYNVQTAYFTSPSIATNVEMMKSRALLLHEYSTQSYHQLIDRRNYFLHIMDARMKHFGYNTIKKAMCASYFEKGGSVPTFRVVFLDLVDKNQKILNNNVTIALEETKIIGSIKKLILVTPQTLPPVISLMITSMRDMDIKIIPDEHMRFDPGQHAMQPSYRVLQREDIKRISREMGVESENLPRMMPRDGLVQFIGLEPGRGIEFNRDNYLNPIGTTYYARVY